MMVLHLPPLLGIMANDPVCPMHVGQVYVLVDFIGILSKCF